VGWGERLLGTDLTEGGRSEVRTVESSSNVISLGGGRSERAEGEPWSIFPAASEASMNSFSRRVGVPNVEVRVAPERIQRSRTIHAAVLA
jgi:hypothetical protein